MKVRGLAYDSLPLISKRRIDENGFLHVEDCPLTKEQVAPYYGKEIPGFEDLGLEPDKVYYGYRPAAELRRPETVQSVEGIPIQLEHHIDYADAPAKQTRIGSTGTDADFDFPYLKNSLHFQDGYAIQNLKDGKLRELSLAYRYEPVLRRGSFDGQEYDFVMTGIRANHVALVDEGRAGHDVAVCDSKPEGLMQERSAGGALTGTLVQQAQMLEGLADCEPGADADAARAVLVQGIEASARALSAMQGKGAKMGEIEKETLLSDFLKELAAAGIDEAKARATIEKLTGAGAADECGGAGDKPAGDAEIGGEAGAGAEGDAAGAAGAGADKAAGTDEAAPVQEVAADEDSPDDTAALKAAGLEDAPDELKRAFIAGLRYVQGAKGDGAAGNAETAKDAEGGEVNQKSFAEGVKYGEAKEKAEPEKLDREHESEGELKALGADSARIVKAVLEQMQGRQRAAEECRGVLGAVDCLAFDNAGEIYRAALKAMGLRSDRMTGRECRAAFRAAAAIRAQSRAGVAQDSKPRGQTAISRALGNVKVGF